MNKKYYIYAAVVVGVFFLGRLSVPEKPMVIQKQEETKKTEEIATDKTEDKKEQKNTKKAKLNIKKPDGTEINLEIEQDLGVVNTLTNESTNVKKSEETKKEELVINDRIYIGPTVGTSLNRLDQYSYGFQGVKTSGRTAIGAGVEHTPQINNTTVKFWWGISFK